MSDHYNTLGVSRTSTPDEIKRAYRKLAAQHHPDRGGDTATFQRIQGAYDIIGNPEKRQEYDNPQPQMGGFNFNGGMPHGFEDIMSHFGEMFGGGARHRSQPQRNRTLNIQTQISLEEAFAGKELIATIKLPSGREQVLEIKIPAGISHGTTLRLAGLGDDSLPNMPKGDIHLTVLIPDHPEFQRHGDDLAVNLTINCIEAMLGTQKTINTLDGKTIEIKINPGTQHGQTLAAQGYGMPNISDSRFKGRLLIKINVQIVESLNEKQKTLLQQFFN